MTQIPQEVFDIGILNKGYHDRLLLDLDRWAHAANIPAHWIWSKLSLYCTDADLEWVKKMKSGHDNGLVYVGKLKGPIEDKMMAIAGACLRNYIDARVMTLQQVIDRMEDGNMPEPTVLLIPNFCLVKGNGGDIAPWQISSLLGLLYSRMAKDLKTVLYVSSLTALESGYGTPFKEHIQSHYTVLGQ